MSFPFETEFGKFNADESALLLRQPETGMGYQIFNDPLKLMDDPIVVSNASFLSVFKQIGSMPVFTDFNKLQLKYEEFDYGELKALFQNGFSVATNATFVTTAQTALTSLPSYLYITRPGDEFRRLSAYRHDKRLQKDGSLLPGTYGTTISDLRVVPSGIAAVGRYALPNRIAACYVYQIVPEPGTHVYFGTVEPNFGLCGGGVEVYFPNGCASDSTRLIETIGEI